MGLPTQFKHLTLDQVMQYHALTQDSDLYKLDRDTKALSILMNKSVDEVEAMDFDYRRQCLSLTQFALLPPKDIPVKKKLIVKGHILYPTLSLQEMKVNQLVDFYSIYKQSENDHLKCANDLLAVMYKPFSLGREPKYDHNKHSKISKLLLSAKAEDCLGMLFFYSRFLRKCAPIIKVCLEKSIPILEEVWKEIQTNKEFQHFLKTGDGSTTSTYVDRDRE